MAKFRQHKRVTLVNKGHRKVRAARQDLYPVELQTCGKYMQLFLFPLFHGKSSLTLINYLFSWWPTSVAIASNNTGQKHSRLSAEKWACSHGCIFTCMFVLPLQTVFSADVPHIEKANYGQVVTSAVQCRLTHLKKQSHRSIGVETALKVGACRHFLDGDERSETRGLRGFGMGRGSNICRPKRAREGKKEKRCVCRWCNSSAIVSPGRELN